MNQNNKICVIDTHHVGKSKVKCYGSVKAFSAYKVFIQPDQNQLQTLKKAASTEKSQNNKESRLFAERNSLKQNNIQKLQNVGKISKKKMIGSKNVVHAQIKIIPDKPYCSRQQQMIFQRKQVQIKLAKQNKVKTKVIGKQKKTSAFISTIQANQLRKQLEKQRQQNDTIKSYESKKIVEQDNDDDLVNIEKIVENQLKFLSLADTPKTLSENQNFNLSKNQNETEQLKFQQIQNENNSNACTPTPPPSQHSFSSKTISHNPNTENIEPQQQHHHLTTEQSQELSMYDNSPQCDGIIQSYTKALISGKSTQDVKILSSKKSIPAYQEQIFQEDVKICPNNQEADCKVQSQVAKTSLKNLQKQQSIQFQQSQKQDLNDELRQLKNSEPNETNIIESLEKQIKQIDKQKLQGECINFALQTYTNELSNKDPPKQNANLQSLHQQKVEQNDKEGLEKSVSLQKNKIQTKDLEYFEKYNQSTVKNKNQQIDESCRNQLIQSEKVQSQIGSEQTLIQHNENKSYQQKQIKNQIQIKTSFSSSKIDKKNENIMIKSFEQQKIENSRFTQKGQEILINEKETKNQSRQYNLENKQPKSDIDLISVDQNDIQVMIKSKTSQKSQKQFNDQQKLFKNSHFLLKRPEGVFQNFSEKKIIKIHSEESNKFKQEYKNVKTQNQNKLEFIGQKNQLKKIGIFKLKDSRKKKIDIEQEDNQLQTKKNFEKENQTKNFVLRNQKRRKSNIVTSSPYLQPVFRSLNLKNQKITNNQSKSSNDESKQVVQKIKKTTHFQEKQIQRLKQQYKKIIGIEQKQKLISSSRKNNHKQKSITSDESNQKNQKHFLKAHSHQFSYLYPSASLNETGQKLNKKLGELDKKLKKISYSVGIKNEKVHEYVSYARKQLQNSKQYTLQNEL